MILFEILNIRAAAIQAAGDSPDLSPSSAAARFPPLIPEVSAGLVAFVVFGTTKVYRTYLWRKLVPRKPSQPRRMTRPSAATSGDPLAASAPKLEAGALSRTELHKMSFTDDVLRSLHETEMSRESAPSSNVDTCVDIEDRSAWYSDEESAAASHDQSLRSNKVMGGLAR